MLSAVDSLGAEFGGSLGSLKEWTDQRTLRDELMRLPAAGLERLQTALDQLNFSRLPTAVR